MLAAETIERVRESADIVAIAGEHVALRRRGQNFFGVCPFHSERSPSFSVHPAKQKYHCFGCGVGGDVIDFVARIQKTDFLGATKSLAARAGIPLEGVASQEAQRLRDERERETKAAIRLSQLERASFFEARENCHQLEKIRRLASTRLRAIHRGKAERFTDEEGCAWLALSDVSRWMPNAAASYTIMAFGSLDLRMRFAIHPEQREQLIDKALEAGFISNERGHCHEVLL